MHTELKAYYDSKSKRPQEILEDSNRTSLPS